MNLGKTLYVTTRKSWRAWLSKYHKTESEIWLIFYKKDSDKPRISYDNAVLEALCYGWIDSIAKKIDDERFAQRFSPRKPKSSFSQINKERVRELIKQKKMTKAGLAAIAHVYDPKTDKKEKFTMPAGILKALTADKDAWNNFQKMPGSYKRIRVTYIESRKRHGVAIYQKALKYFVKMTAQNKR
ncbi:MAG: YdeI/OmpD-associated family protein, partial [Candidatus Yanofskybacteria bacterium]|nr:YdeI/OmpD-associated family protein [Candidatus Yanofskybacteria bacterium]